MLPGGKVKEFEKSRNAINREIQEEIRYDNKDYSIKEIEGLTFFSEKHHKSFVYKE